MSHSLLTAGPDTRPTSMVTLGTTRLVRKHLDATRYEDFWFHDGSIVLLVGALMFRVHQTVLSAHSEVFAGLFILPQPPSGTKGQEMIEGCHVVQLHDSPEDFIDLLKGIYHPSHFDTIPEELGNVLSWISGMLRLSTKYMVVSLRQRCISILKSRFPTTFPDYNALMANPHRKHYKSDDIMRTVLLAQECNVREILPYTYYCVARMGLTRIVADSPGDISWKEKAICLVGRERLRWAEMSLSHSFLFAFRPAPTCQTPQCGLARGPQKEWRVLEAARSPNPLKLFVRWQMLNVCGECIAHAQNQHQAGREEVWQHLPVIFELPAWDELRVENVTHHVYDVSVLLHPSFAFRILYPSSALFGVLDIRVDAKPPADPSIYGCRCLRVSDSSGGTATRSDWTLLMISSCYINASLVGGCIKARASFDPGNRLHLNFHFLSSIFFYSSFLDEMFSFFTTLMAGLLLASVNVAAADLSESQQCVLDCSLKAVTASKCDISDSACICASSPYSTELTQCATSACKFTTASVQSLLKDGCPSGAAPVVGAAAANSADLNGARTGLVAVSAIGLVSYALLV